MFLIAFALGAFAVWAEAASLFPSYLSVRLIGFGDWKQLIGPCLMHSAIVPILFLLGFHRSSYWYSSALALSIFFFTKGAELQLFWLFCSGFSFLCILSILLLALIVKILIGARSIAARPLHTTFSSFIIYLIRYWGVLLIVQFLLYLIILLEN